MTNESETYQDWRAVEQAIKSAATEAHQQDPTRIVADLIRQAHYDRFLCRVFSDGDASEWILKGGSGMLARVPNTRRTLDADLYREGYNKDLALRDLRRVTNVDLGDFFRFVYLRHTTILADDLQPYADGYRILFDAYLGPKPLEQIKVDLSTHVGATTAAMPATPANRLALPKLPSFDYRLYPIENQVADKVCAILTTHNGKPSSREKDLVDLVVIALTQTIDATDAQAALHHEAQLRRLDLPETFTTPATWGAGYANGAKNTPAAHYKITDAQMLMAAFIGPLLAGITIESHWSPEMLQWVV